MLDLAIRRRLSRYLCAQEDLASLEAWVLSEADNIYASSDQASQDLASDILRFIAEFDRGHRTEEDLRGHLRQLLDVQFVELDGSPAARWRAVSSGPTTTVSAQA